MDFVEIWIYIWIALAVVAFLGLLIQRAPYGRFKRGNWGPEINNRLAWIGMELPSLALFSLFFFRAEGRASLVVWIFFSLWVLHYAYRSLIYPLRLRSSGATMPLVIALLSFLFNTINSFLNGSYLGVAGPVYSADWLGDPRFIAGLLLFAIGISANIHSDNILLRLRKTGGSAYRIPHGGLFRLVSCPNYLGEMVEWGGFALMVWSLPATSFWIWCLANLLPRALAYHRWYNDTFPDYPSSRKAVVPFLL